MSQGHRPSQLPPVHAFEFLSRAGFQHSSLSSRSRTAIFWCLCSLTSPAGGKNGHGADNNEATVSPSACQEHGPHGVRSHGSHASPAVAVPHRKVIFFIFFYNESRVWRPNWYRLWEGGRKIHSMARTAEGSLYRSSFSFCFSPVKKTHPTNVQCTEGSIWGNVVEAEGAKSVAFHKAFSTGGFLCVSLSLCGIGLPVYHLLLTSTLETSHRWS